MLHQTETPKVNIVGDFDRNQLFCAGSVSKMLTTFVVLSFLHNMKYNLNEILNDQAFLDQICSDKNNALDFLRVFQKKITSKFTIRDLCTFHTGLPYTFDPTEEEIASLNEGGRYTHHSLMDEKAFLQMCENNIDMVYSNRQKFHYSEISIMVLGYLIEKVYDVKIEDLYQEFLVNKFHLSKSQLSRTRPADAFYKDLSGKYDYACVALQHHGFFCYGNGFYTTLNDLSILLKNINSDPVFCIMVDLEQARRAEDNTVMNGLTIEMRMQNRDKVFGYEGMSNGGVTTLMYSTMQNTWYVKFGEDADEDFEELCAKLHFNNDRWDDVPDKANEFYTKFITNYPGHSEAKIEIEYQGKYRRVRLNDESELKDVFELGSNYLKIRDPKAVTYTLVYANGKTHVKDEDGVRGSKIGFFASKYISYNDILYRKISDENSPRNI